MKNMTSSELNKKIKELKTELAKELNENGTSKRAYFLAATISQYAEKLDK